MFRFTVVEPLGSSGTILHFMFWNVFLHADYPYEFVVIIHVGVASASSWCRCCLCLCGHSSSNSCKQCVCFHVASNAAGIIDWRRRMDSRCFGGGVGLVVYRVQGVSGMVK